MSWLAQLDRHSHHWPAPARWSYTGLKWGLIALGAWLAVELAITQRGGIGLGIVVAMTLALVKGVAMAFKRH